MATGSEILSYRPDERLGLGANPSTPALPDQNALNTINSTVRDIMLLNQQTNMELFKQKVQDRDQLRALIYNNQVQTEEIDPADQKHFDEAKQNSIDAFEKWGGDMNDTKGYAKYQESINNLRGVATHAQLRWAQLTKMKQDIAQETLPWKRKDMQDWYDKQSNKPFWAQVDPYQQRFDFQVKPILDNLKTGQTIIRGEDGFYYNQGYADYEATQKAMNATFAENGQTAEDMRQLFTRIQNYTPAERIKFVNSINSQIDKYNEAWGTKSGNEAQHLNVDMSTGQAVINEAIPDFAAKYTLASQEKYVSQMPNKEMNDAYSKRMDTMLKGQQVAIAQERANIEAKKLGIEGEKARAYVDYMETRANKLNKDNAQTVTDIGQQMDSYIKNIQTVPVGQDKGGWFGIGSKKGTPQDAVVLNDLPQSYQYISGPVINSKGKVTVQQIKPFTATVNGKDVNYYIPKYVDPNSGKELTKDFLLQKYSQIKDQVGTWNDYLNQLQKKGILELVLKGQNGSANTASIFSSAKTIAEQGGKKGMENIVNPPNSGATQDEDQTPDDDQ